jgi:hypothetical protein
MLCLLTLPELECQLTFAAPMKKPIRLHEILYVSVIAPDAPLSIIADIAAKSRSANQKLDITGLLIFDGMRFCQQLEGNRKEVLTLTERIRQDPRHTNVEIIHHGPLAERRFRRFSLGYTSMEDVDVLAHMENLDGQAALEAFLGLLPALDLDA